MPPALYLSARSLDALPWPAGHRLAIPRLPLTEALLEAQGWLAPGQAVPAPQADRPALERFHTAAYLDALERAERVGDLPLAVAERHRLAAPSLMRAVLQRGGPLPENPVFAGMVQRHATAAGAGLLAAQQLLAGPAAVLAPVGGSHHARPDAARGYCYFNDIALAIGALLEGGMGRVLYVDLDAHHGDAVEAAFAQDLRVLTISLHRRGSWESGDDLRPAGSVNALNLPLPAGTDDGGLLYLLKHAVLPAARAFRPQAVVLLSGADGLHDDPVGGLGFSTAGLWRAAAEVLALSDRQLVLGGGGYNPVAAARLWAGLWAQMTGHDPAAPLTPAASALLQALPGAPPPRASLGEPLRLGPIRPEIARLAYDAATLLPQLDRATPRPAAPRRLAALRP